MPRIRAAVATGRRVLVVDDDAELRRSTVRLLRRKGYEARGAGDGAAALEVLRDFAPHGILLDWYLDDTTAEQLLPALHQRAPDVPILLVSGWTSLPPGSALIDRLGVAGFHDKGEGAAALLDRVDDLMGGGRVA